MKKISHLLSGKNLNKKMVLDEKTIFYIFNKIIEAEYGARGLANFVPKVLVNKKIIIVCQSSSWKNELWLNQGEIIKKINDELGQGAIVEIKFN